MMTALSKHFTIIASMRNFFFENQLKIEGSFARYCTASFIQHRELLEDAQAAAAAVGKRTAWTAKGLGSNLHRDGIH